MPEKRARAAFELRKIGLRQSLLQILIDGLNKFLLGHGAVEPAQRAFHFPEVAKFLARVILQSEIEILQYAIYRKLENSPSSPTGAFEF